MKDPWREAIATSGAQRGAARTLGSVTGRSVPKRFRVGDAIELDSTAASFKFNNVVSELRAKLDRGERLLRPVEAVKGGNSREGVPLWNPNVGTAEDRQPEWVFIATDIGPNFRQCLPESRWRCFEDPDRMMTDGRNSDAEHRYNYGGRATSGYGSMDSGGRRAEGVGWEIPLGRGGFRARFSESVRVGRGVWELRCGD